jgi:hypothetical protein
VYPLSSAGDDNESTPLSTPLARIIYEGSLVPHPSLTLPRKHGSCEVLYSLIAGEVCYDAGGSSGPSKKFWVLDETSDPSRFSRKSREFRANS